MDKLIKVKEFIANKLSSQNLPGTKDFEFYYNAGIDFYGKQEYEKAIESFKSAIEQKDIKPQVYYNLALSYQSMQNYDRAIVNYNKFLEYNSTDYDGLYNLALVYFMRENFSKAVEIFEKCVEIKIDEDGVKSLVLAYLSNNQSQMASDYAQNILNTQEDGLKLYYEIARVFENKNSFNKDFVFLDTAIEMYLKIIEIDPKFFDAYLSVSICYAKKGDFAQSVDFCEKALVANPKSYEANNQMGLVYYCSNEVKDAIKYYEEALKLKPEGDFKIYSNLGYAYEKIGKYDNAVNMFAQLVQKFPHYPAKDEIKNHLRILKTL